MIEISDIIELFTQAIQKFQNNELNLLSPLDKIVIDSVGSNLAYIDHRKDANNIYKFNFWEQIQTKLGKNSFNGLPRKLNIKKSSLYSNSNQFPDYLFKVREYNGDLTCGNLLELKDSKSGTIASFNSTLPTQFKNLKEIDIINGAKPSLVSKIASFIDGRNLKGEYYNFNRRCFYLVRTHKEKINRVKISIIEGSFFETVPKNHLIHQIFLKIFQDHVAKKQIVISDDLIREIEKVLSKITDQTIIAASQIIKGASIKPRLRIMAEVHPEGNPHSKHYSEISEQTFNLILQLTPQTSKLKEKLLKGISELNIFQIKHKRNGEHLVFQFGLTS